MTWATSGSQRSSLTMKRIGTKNAVVFNELSSVVAKSACRKSDDDSKERQSERVHRADTHVTNSCVSFWVSPRVTIGNEWQRMMEIIERSGQMKTQYRQPFGSYHSENTAPLVKVSSVTVNRRVVSSLPRCQFLWSL